MDLIQLLSTVSLGSTVFTLQQGELTLNELSTAKQFQINAELNALVKKEGTTDEDFVLFQAKVVAQSLKGDDAEVSEADVQAIIAKIGVNTLTQLYESVLKFNGQTTEAQEEAKKN